MTRRQFLSGATASLAVPSLARSSEPAKSKPKNVLILMSDQHKRSCMGIAGDRVAKTPNLDALGQSAVRFTNLYCTNPVCTPSRASFLTGLYTHHHESWNNVTPLPLKHKTIAYHFGKAGYATALVGKMHFVDAQTHGFDYHLDFNDWYQYLGPKTKLYADELSRANSGSGLPQIDDLWRDFGDPWKGDRELDDRQGPVAVGAVSAMPERDHFESFVARESVRFLRNYGKSDQPFLLIASFLKPHDPFMPARRFAEMFRPEDMRLPDTWGKADLAHIPKQVRNSIQHNAPTPELRDREQALRRIAYYYANIAQMDDCAGIVLRALRDLGLEDDTIVLYTSDHGEMLGEHGLWQKFQFYESSCGVPLLMRVPGLEGNRVCQAPLSQVSVMPTLADLCHVPVSTPVDGTSLVEYLRAPDRQSSQPVFAEYDLRRPSAKYMIRDGDLKYSFWTHDMPELYDLRSDPQEMKNLALEPEHRDDVARLKTKLFQWYTPPEIQLSTSS